MHLMMLFSFFKELDELITLYEELSSKIILLMQFFYQYSSHGEQSLLLEDVMSIKKGDQLNKDLLNDEYKYSVYNCSVSEIGKYHSYNCEGPKIIINEGGNPGLVKYVEDNFWASGHCFIVKNKSKLFSIKELYTILKSNEFLFKKYIKGSTIQNISQYDILTTKVMYSKQIGLISDIIFNLNDLSDLTNKKIHLLNLTKKYFLNVMFC